MNTTSDKTAIASLHTLIILQLVMLVALYAGVRPHPPATIPLFAIAPFLGAAISSAFVAIAFATTDTKVGRIFCIIAAFLAAISFGPQKFFDPQFYLIWPAVIAGQIAIVALAIQVKRQLF